MRDMRKWMNADFISALDLLKDDGSGYKTLEVVIDKVHSPTLVQCGPKKENLVVLSFKKAQKRMILRDAHMKGLIKLLGPDADKMAGKKVCLWVEEDVKAFGNIVDCVRFKDSSGKGRRSLLPDHSTAKIEREVALIVAPPNSPLGKDLPREEPTESDQFEAFKVQEEKPTGQQEVER